MTQIISGQQDRIRHRSRHPEPAPGARQHRIAARRRRQGASLPHPSRGRDPRDHQRQAELHVGWRRTHRRRRRHHPSARRHDSPIRSTGGRSGLRDRDPPARQSSKQLKRGVARADDSLQDNEGSLGARTSRQTFDQFDDFGTLVGRKFKEGLQQSQAFHRFARWSSEFLLQLRNICGIFHLAP